jgi:hypothetical protein
MFYSTAAAISLAMTAVEPACAGGLTLAHPYYYSGSDAIDTWARNLSACAEEVTGIHVEVIGGGKLGRPRDLADAVAGGLIDMALLPAGALDKRWPELSGLDRPGLVYDPQDRMKLSQSRTFIESLNNLAGRDHDLELVAVGWRYAIPVSAASGLEDLRGKKLGVRDVKTRKVLERVGADAVQIPASEIMLALRYGAIDGAIVDADVVRSGVGRGGFKELQWSPDFAPFASAVVLVMNSITAETFGENLPSRISIECLHVTREFNAGELEEMARLTNDARAKDAKVSSVSEAERERWRNALEDVRTRGLGRHEPVADAMRGALHQQ